MKISHLCLAILAFGSACIGHPASAQTQTEADALYAAQDWPAATRAYRALLADEPGSGQNWFNLGRALHQDGDAAGARDAYERAIEEGYPAVPRARYHLARALMSLGDRDGALEQLERVAETGGPTNQTLLSTTEFEPLNGAPRYEAVVTALTPCREPVYRDYDFWLGHWDVTASGSPTPTAQSSITAVQDGCVILEQYAAGPYTGMSLSFYDSVSERWHQTWMSNAGGAAYIEGGLDASGAMVMTDAELPVSERTGQINRVTWTSNPDGTVRQLWEQSTDGGENWSVAFDGLYSRRAAEQ